MRPSIEWFTKSRLAVPAVLSVVWLLGLGLGPDPARAAERSTASAAQNEPGLIRSARNGL
jgi:hypothetical protein